MNKFSLLIMAALTISACQTPMKLRTPDKATDKVTILTYNVENLFNQGDDVDKNDESFLPEEKKSSAAMINRCHSQNDAKRYVEECLNKDWSNLAYNRKLRRLTDVIAQVGKGAGPDILILQEVENVAVLEDWRTRYLAPMGYGPAILEEGPDERGIDTAIMTRLPVVGKPKLHTLDYTDSGIPVDDQKKTRGILEARLQMPNGQQMAVFAVHLPAQGAESIHRKVGLKTLLKLTDAVEAGTPVLVGGDFNITSKEDWKHKYFRDMVSPHLAVSHMIGCDGCAGTIYFPPDQTWSFFDVLLFSKDLTSATAPWQVDPKSIKIVNSSLYQRNRYGTPARFGKGYGNTGVSDHWPMYAEIVLKAPTKLGAQ